MILERTMLVVVAMMTVMCVGVDVDVDLTLETTISSPHLDYAVEAHTYAGLSPHVLVVTTRESGLSLWNTSKPVDPHIITTWSESKTVEGQAWDAESSTLMVVDIGRSGIWTFSLSMGHRDPELDQLGYVSVSQAGALHARFFRPGDGRVYGVVSVGFNITDPSLVVIDLASPATPQVVGRLAMPSMLGMEGVFIVDSYALVGGYGSHLFQVVDLSNVVDMKIVKTLEEPYFLQMVSAGIESPTQVDVPCGIDEDVVYTALWGDVGGLATFNASDPRHLVEIGHVVGEELGKANRVHLDIHRSLAFLPLEGHAPGQPGPNGGVAVIDVADPAHLKQVVAMRLPETTLCYTLALIGAQGEGGATHMYAFGANTKTLYVYAVKD